MQEAIVSHDGYTGEVHCTGNPKQWFIEEQTSLFVCPARRDCGGCDWFHATLGNAGWSVRLDRRNGGCVLPS